MPRSYKKGNVRAKWSVENLNSAVSDVTLKQLNINQASQKYGIPYTAIKDHVNHRCRIASDPKREKYIMSEKY